MARKGSGSGITSLPGVGAATAKKLTAAKLGTVAKLAKASVGDLEKAGLTAAVAKKVSAAGSVNAALDFLCRRWLTFRLHAPLELL